MLFSDTLDQAPGFAVGREFRLPEEIDVVRIAVKVLIVLLTLAQSYNPLLTVARLLRLPACNVVVTIPNRLSIVLLSLAHEFVLVFEPVAGSGLIVKSFTVSWLLMASLHCSLAALNAAID